MKELKIETGKKEYNLGGKVTVEFSISPLSSTVKRPMVRLPPGVTVVGMDSEPPPSPPRPVTSTALPSYRSAVAKLLWNLAIRKQDAAALSNMDVLIAVNGLAHRSIEIQILHWCILLLKSFVYLAST